MKNILIFIAMSLSLVSCSSVNKYFGLKDDNVIEETIEAAIHYETGLDVDLTPESKE